MQSKVLICTLGVLLGLAGCVDKNAPSNPQGQRNTPATPAADAQLQPGGTLRLPLTIDISDKAVTGLDLSDPRLFALARAIELPLMRALPDGSLGPGLASSHVAADGGKTWVFELRQPEGSADQPGYLGEHLIQRYKDILRGPDSPLRAQLSDLLEGGRDYASGRGDQIAGLTLEGNTLTAKLTRPHQAFASWASQPGLGVLLSRELPAAGFGPFGLVAVEGKELVLKPNPDALDGAPLLDELRFVCEPDPRQQLALYRAGELDAANLAYDDVAAVRADTALESARVEHVTAAMYLGFFNLSRLPWGDQQFQSKVGLRKSVNQVLNLPLLAEAYAGQLSPWRHFLPPQHKDYIGSALVQSPVFANSQQLEKARASQIEADNEQGNNLLPGMDLGYLTAGPVDPFLVSEVLRYWRDISVKMRPFPLTGDELALRLGKGTHEILLMQHRPAYQDVDGALYPLLHSALSGPEGNWQLLSDKDIDKALADGQAAGSDNARRKIYQVLSETLEQRALAVFLGNSTPTLLVNPRIGGLRLSPFDYDASLPAQDFARLGIAAQ